MLKQNTCFLGIRTIFIFKENLESYRHIVEEYFRVLGFGIKEDSLQDNKFGYNSISIKIWTEEVLSGKHQPAQLEWLPHFISRRLHKTGKSGSGLLVQDGTEWWLQKPH